MSLKTPNNLEPNNLRNNKLRERIKTLGNSVS